MYLRNLGSMLVGVVALAGSAVAAEPTVTVGGVTSGEIWSKITVSYTLGGVDLQTDYKVAFDVTAGGLNASITNDAARLVDGAATKEIDTVALFGKQVTDTKAKVKVSLIAVKSLGGVQLWEGGPYFAECNIGATKPEDYGYYFWWGDTVGYTNTNPGVRQYDSNEKWVSVKDGTTIEFYTDSLANSTYGKDVATLKSEGWIGEDGNLLPMNDAATVHLGAPWRMITDAELQKLVSTEYCEHIWTTDWKGTGKAGYIIKGKGAYSSNSVFFPAAGFGYGNQLVGFTEEHWGSNIYPDVVWVGYGTDNRYWGSTVSSDDTYAWSVNFSPSKIWRDNDFRYAGYPVRPVR